MHSPCSYSVPNHVGFKSEHAMMPGGEDKVYSFYFNKQAHS